MSVFNMYLTSLLEAADDEKEKDAPAEDTSEEETNPDSDTKEDAAENESKEENSEEFNEAEDENKDNEEENKEDDSQSEDDFSLDPESSEEDDGPPPDGLTNPDDMGEDDGLSSEDDEVNIHTNILQLSKLDRTLAMRKCYNDFMDLRSSISSFKKIIQDNEASIEAEKRNFLIEKLNELYTTVTDYIVIRFQTINYEENLQNYLLFVNQMNSLVEVLNPNSKNKKSKKSDKN